MNKLNYFLAGMNTFADNDNMDFIRSSQQSGTEAASWKRQIKVHLKLGSVSKFLESNSIANLLDTADETSESGKGFSRFSESQTDLDLQDHTLGFSSQDFITSDFSNHNNESGDLYEAEERLTFFTGRANTSLAIRIPYSEEQKRIIPDLVRPEEEKMTKLVVISSNKDQDPQTVKIQREHALNNQTKTNNKKSKAKKKNSGNDKTSVPPVAKYWRGTLSTIFAKALGDKMVEGEQEDEKPDTTNPHYLQLKLLAKIKSNFTRERGQEKTLEDCFKSHKNCLQFCINYCQEKLKGKKGYKPKNRKEPSLSTDSKERSKSKIKSSWDYRIKNKTRLKKVLDPEESKEDEDEEEKEESEVNEENKERDKKEERVAVAGLVKELMIEDFFRKEYYDICISNHPRQLADNGLEFLIQHREKFKECFKNPHQRISFKYNK